MEERKKVDRLSIIKNLILVAFVVILVKILYMTTFKYEHYTELAENKTYKQLLIKAPRGEIKDRYGFVDKKIEYYMQQELLEGYLNKNDIKVITNNKFKMSLELNEKIYKNLNVEELFIEALRISTKINFKYQNNNIVISLNKLGIENEYVILLNKLLKYIDSKL